MPLRLAKLSYEFPLLTKELIEQANRRRTYAIRTLYALILFTVFGAFLYALVSASGAVDTAALGRGLGAFELVVAAQMAGIFLLMPALIADVVTREREHQTLDLLLITQLRPTDIILQKLLSRFVPMGTFLLLSTPLVAVAYAYGGVSAQRLATTIYILVLTCAWAGAICMVKCIDARKTSMAMLSAYIRLPMTIMLLAILSNLAGLGIYAGLMMGEWLNDFFGGAPWVHIPWSWIAFSLVPPGILLTDEPAPFWVTVLVTAPSWLLVWRYLSKARRMLMSTVMATLDGKPSFELARVPDFRRDRPRSPKLPDERPVTWFELNSRTMRQLWKVFWFACIIDLPILIWLAKEFNLSYEDYERRQLEGFALLTAGLWVVGGIVLGLVACSVFAPERHGQTLEVLLSTPLRTRDLVIQKLSAPRRLALLFLLPMTIALLYEWWYESTSFTAFQGFNRRALTDLLGAFSCLAVYPWLIIWTGLWLGMRIRDRTRAAVALLVLGAVWVFILPIAFDTALDLYRVPRPELDEKVVWTGPLTYRETERSPVELTPAPKAWLRDVHLLSPASVLMAAETGRWGRWLLGAPWLLIAINTLFYTALTLAIRRACLNHAALYLGRIPEPPHAPVPPAAPAAPVVAHA